MLTREENDLVTRVGPGSPMGEVIRRYWMPMLLSGDLPEPDGAPMRVKLLGEELVAFRDTQGRVGLIDELCAHRCASLFLGRNEENGLRCVYHGWKYDVHGNCVDMPNEPVENRFEKRIRLTAYPTAEAAGIIWAYMGPPAKQPPLPNFEWMRAPTTHYHVTKTLEQCNYLQAIEGGIDTAHGTFLHNNNLAANALGRTTRDAAPRLEPERTSYGMRFAGIRDWGDRGNYTRIYHFVMPFHQLRSQQVVRSSTEPGVREGVPMVRGHAWVPIDDETTWVFNWDLAVDEDKPLTPEFIFETDVSCGRGPDGEVAAMRRRTRANDWLIDREMQRSQNFTGIFGTNTQDLAAQESMGFIVDRSREHLGTTDRAIMLTRQIFLDAIKDLREGIDPPGVDPDSYRAMRAVDVVLPKDVRWQDVADRELVARW